jgi:hypothetical protein
MIDIFISYSRRDVEFVRSLYAALTAGGLDVWVDLKDIDYSTQWWDEICSAIDRAQNMLFVISPDSLSSEYCHRELARARAANKRIITVLHRQAQGGAVQEALHGKEWEQQALENWAHVRAIQFLPMRDEDNFAHALAQLKRVLATDHESVRIHTRLGMRAGEWAARPDTSLLLRGSDLRDAESWLSRKPTPLPTAAQFAYVAASRAEEDRQRWERRVLTLRQFLGLRYLGAALGSGFSIGIAAYLLRADTALGTLAALRLMSALALGALFGCLLGLAILAATELRSILPASLQRMSSLFAWASGALVAAVGFALYHAMQRGSMPGDVLLWIGSALLFTAGFCLPGDHFRGAALRALAGAGGVFSALYVPQLLTPRGIFEFGALALPLSLGSALLIGLLTFLPEFYGVQRPGTE